jgi:hypothetical protein
MNFANLFRLHSTGTLTRPILSRIITRKISNPSPSTSKNIPQDHIFPPQRPVPNIDEGGEGFSRAAKDVIKTGNDSVKEKMPGGLKDTAHAISEKTKQAAETAKVVPESVKQASDAASVAKDKAGEMTKDLDSRVVIILE